MPSVLSIGSLLFAALPALAPAHPGHAPQSCQGCVGAGGTASSSGGTCGGMVSISVQVEPGECKWFYGTDELVYECSQTRKCSTNITRRWSGLPPNTDLDQCVVVLTDKLCLRPRPSSGTGSGEESRPGPKLECSDNPGDELTFLIESAVCGLSAQVNATCSSCAGDS